MNRKDLKRKALEPVFVAGKIAELTSELKKNDATLREEIQALRDEISDLKTQLTSKTEECSHMEAEAQFLHPDAVMDRVRTKYWHHGDLSLLRRAIDPRTRKLRITKSRGDRSLYLCDTAPKKAKKTHVRDGRSSKHELKRECKQSPGTETTDSPSTHSTHDAHEKYQEESDVDSVSTRGEKEQDEAGSDSEPHSDEKAVSDSDADSGLPTEAKVQGTLDADRVLSREETELGKPDSGSRLPEPQEGTSATTLPQEKETQMLWQH
ncbi:unnamed protein product [Hyaloperonospora brassicae]|uniref:Uncharacterized protein n=1 Tax=Hyaloperonospora brassicae TaxID=162125 RepID=A0AAV0TYZ1_HYABA|nr:unnamed protein product [Hyaloperonospora brassicae]